MSQKHAKFSFLDFFSHLSPSHFPLDMTKAKPKGEEYLEVYRVEVLIRVELVEHKIIKLHAAWKCKKGKKKSLLNLFCFS